MKKFSISTLLAITGLVFLGLACRVTDVIAQINAAVTETPTRARATFTRAAIAIEEPTNPPPPTPLPTHMPPSTPRPATRAPTPRPATAAPPPPTPDPYAGYYYKPVNKGCVAAPNTRIQGTVIESGVKKNGVRVRVALSEGGDPVIDDFITGIDPSDYKHIDPSLQGQYRLGLFEGQQNAGNWWVFILDGGGNRISPGVYVNTQDGNGCNTATIDFVH